MCQEIADIFSNLMDFNNLRKEYLLKHLTEEMLLEDPFAQFRLWLDEAMRQRITEPTAMCLATCNTLGRPSCRMVLLKRLDSDGLVFFTNLHSRKASELSENPHAAATFWWGDLERQVRFEGSIVKIPAQESEAYFAKRPRKSQLGAWASTKQSAVITSREILEESLHKFEEKFQDQQVPMPPFWCGYKLMPHAIEFWQGRENRLHDRLAYVLENQTWQIKRLSP